MNAQTSSSNPWGVPNPPPTTEAEFFNAVRPTVILLVEGGSDERFWVSRVDRRRCLVREMGGKPNVLDELHTARAEQKSGFIAILDADFERLEGTLRSDPDIVWTDLHDLETVIIASPALDKVLAAVGSREKREKFEESQSVRDALLDNGIPLGQLRWLSHRENLGLKFKKLQQGEKEFRTINHHDFCDKSSWKVDPKKLIKAALDFGQRHDLKGDDLLRRIAALPKADPWQLCVGHDLVAYLCIGLQSKLGNGPKRSIEECQTLLGLAFELGHLQQTDMYNALRAWENRNQGFHIFP